MAKQCPECRTVMPDLAPYCEACGCHFVKVPAVPSNNGRRFLSYGIVVMLAIAIGVYLRYC